MDSPRHLLEQLPPNNSEITTLESPISSKSLQLQQQQQKHISRKSKYWDLWVKNWLLLGLAVGITLAHYFPGAGKTGGPIRPEYSVKYGITACIFLLSGLSLKTKDILKSALNYRAHLVTQLTSFIAIPLFVKALTTLLGFSSLNDTLLAGMCFTSAMPTTISSNVVMTSNSDGTESLALFNAALGNLLGVFISPIIVLILLHSTPQSPVGNGDTFSGISVGEIFAVGVTQGVTFTVAAFFLGCVSRVRPRKIRILKAMDECRSAQERRKAQLEQGQDESGTAAYTLECHCTEGLSLPRTSFQRLVEPMSKKDTVAIIFCGGTKSAAIGIPMIKILYSGSTGSTLVGLLATPLVMYHVEQLFGGAFMVGWLKKWVGLGEEELETFGAEKEKSERQDCVIQN
ncbi:hypothetical protein BGX26_002664 [Mortierella sp. AD094]|nr:hypothetical protein BGX26_002664 [Mortierella sp. AD094]